MRTNEKVGNVEKLTAEHEKRIATLEEKVKDLERQQRRQNLRLYRLQEKEGENIKNMITDICQQVVPQENVDICHRVGRKSQARCVL